MKWHNKTLKLETFRMIFAHPNYQARVVFEIEGERVIDYYDYHDAPSTISLTMELEETKELVKAMNEAVKDMQEMK